VLKPLTKIPEKGKKCARAGMGGLGAKGLWSFTLPPPPNEKYSQQYKQESFSKSQMRINFNTFIDKNSYLNICDRYKQ
jgi:hypothetical protein